MGNIIQEELAAAAAEMVDEISDGVVTWSGADYAAIVDEPSVEVDLSEGGMMPQGDFRVRIPRAAFNAGAGPFPQDGDVIEYDGAEYVTPNASKQRPGSAFIAFDIATNL